MTLIAAFRCAEGGVVLCADSQETIDVPDRGEYRVNVNKLEQKDAGEYEVVIGGAGDGALVDGFVDQLAESVERWRDVCRDDAILGNIRRFVRGYYERDVTLSPAYPDDKNLGFVICLKRKATADISLWRVIDLTVRQVLDLTLLGWEEPLYWREAKRLYHLNQAEATMPSSSEAILLGAYLFSVAKETSNVISGDTKILVVSGETTRVLNPSDAKELEGRVKVFEYLIGMIFLALPDVTVSRTQLKSYLLNFQQTAVQLHDQFTLHVAMTGAARLKALSGSGPPSDDPDEAENDPYLQLPPWEEMKKDFNDDENILAIRKSVQARERQDKAEIGWEQFAYAEPRQLFLDLNNAANALNRAAKLNRALYQAGKYGEPGGADAIALRQEIATGIYQANEELIRLLPSTGGDSQESEES